MLKFCISHFVEKIKKLQLSFSDSFWFNLSLHGVLYLPGTALLSLFIRSNPWIVLFVSFLVSSFLIVLIGSFFFIRKKYKELKEEYKTSLQDSDYIEAIKETEMFLKEVRGVK